TGRRRDLSAHCVHRHAARRGDTLSVVTVGSRTSDGKAAGIAATGVDYVLRGKSIVSGDRRNFGNQRGNGEISYSLRQTRITRNAASGDACSHGCRVFIKEKQ